MRMSTLVVSNQTVEAPPLHLAGVGLQYVGASNEAAVLVEQVGQAAAGHGLHDEAEAAGRALAAEKLDNVAVLQVAGAGRSGR